jgi:hypothetical protein
LPFALWHCDSQPRVSRTLQAGYRHSLTAAGREALIGTMHVGTALSGGSDL